MNNVMAVSRMQLVNRWNFIGVPLIIMGGAFALSLVLFYLIPTGPTYSGGASMASVWYFFALGIQCLTLTFPFALGLSVTRKAYFVGTYLTFTMVAVGVSLIYVLGSLIELNTQGWGLDGYFFRQPWILDGPWWQTLLTTFVLTMLMFTLGLWGATIYKRWGVAGTLIMVASAALIIVAWALLMQATQQWHVVGQFFVDTQAMGVTAICAGLLVISAVGSYLTIRKAIP